MLEAEKHMDIISPSKMNKKKAKKQVKTTVPTVKNSRTVHIIVETK